MRQLDTYQVELSYNNQVRFIIWRLSFGDMRNPSEAICERRRRIRLGRGWASPSESEDITMQGMVIKAEWSWSAVAGTNCSLEFT